jgi:hypothetical protein
MAQKTRKHRLVFNGSKVCHPRLKGRNGDCLSPDLLRKVGDALEAPTNLQGHLLKRWLTRRTRCKSERCWVEKSPLDTKEKKDIFKAYFRPKMPDEWSENEREWLDTLNIENVLKQYEESNPEFKFYGANPIDFSAPNPYKKGSLERKECLTDDICKIDLKALQAAGKTKLGFVYNMDPSNKGGSHWVASFTDIPAHRSYYFDSYGMKALPQVARFMRALTLQDPKMKLQYNARRFQFRESECGVYCIYFIIRMLEGADFVKFCRSDPRDSDMLLLRQYIYSKTN